MRGSYKTKIRLTIFWHFYKYHPLIVRECDQAVATSQHRPNSMLSDLLCYRVQYLSSLGVSS